ncbi:hypothetical protein STIAU_8501 [Stigmatella aurantiaca DW4/3-1]|uniref:Uncharacterized protein n=1 Tax=Stigmatella aurantiaca (strain DW4/3-1) TaxID=378806 RepID=Q09AS6_STIAD|nr:hypothetical protein STIAU_8501 [Stigmatella aurantiaca DW4/3-1]
MLALGGFLHFRLKARGMKIHLDDGVMSCGFAGNPAVLPQSSSEISFHGKALTLEARGRVVFSEQTEDVTCYRSAESRWGMLKGDFIQVMLPEAPLETTVERWRRLYQQFGAGQRDLQQLGEWATQVASAEREGLTTRDIWLQGSFSIPGTNIGIYAQSIPKNTYPPVRYGAHFTVFWEDPARPPEGQGP